MQKVRLLIIQLSCLAAVGLVFAQCKPRSATKVQSLDDAANGSNQINKANLCGDANFDFTKTSNKFLQAMQTSNQIEIRVNGDQTPLRNAVLAALERVPAGLVQSFLYLGGGHIVVDDAPSLCRTAPFTKEERAIFGNNPVRSCWIAPHTESNTNDYQQLILDRNPDLIRFSLLRLMAYTYAEYYIKVLGNQSFAAKAGHPDPNAVKNFVDGFGSNRQRLAESFLNDMQAARNPNYSAMRSHYAADATSFGNMVYANAVDSYYCSQHTHDVFQQTFKQTWAVFNDNNDPQTPLKQLGEPMPP